jgi:nitronate monooxygenase
MALDTALRAQLSLPAICAPMTAVSGPELVRAACSAGIMGVLPRHNAANREQFAGWLGSIRADLEREFDARGTPAGPLAVNLVIRPDLDALRADLDVCATHGVRVIVSALGDPSVLTRIVHDFGGLVFHDVTRLRHAEKAIAAGVDGLTCIGSGGGGHAGTLNALAFIPRARALFGGTIVFAGGVATGAAIRAAEVLGADLAYLGTRFIASRESLAAAEYKDMIVQGSADDLVYSDRLTGVPASWLRRSLERAGLDPDALPEPVAMRRYDHLPAGFRPWREIWSAGQGLELIDDIPSVAGLVARLRDEYAAACRVPAFVGSA